MKRVVVLVALLVVVLSLGRVGLAYQSGSTPAMGSLAASPTAIATGAAFLTIINHGQNDDELVGAASSISSMVEIHETENHDGMMQMHPVDDVKIHAGETVTFKPGGYHLMLVGLKHDLTPGATFTLTLTFEKAGQVTVPVMVREMSGAIPSGATALAAVTAGSLEIDQAWARPAPSMVGATPMAASPIATGHDDGMHGGNGNGAAGTVESR